MVTTAFVNIWEQRIGAIAWDEVRQIGVFEYDPIFNQSSIELAPIKMPLGRKRPIYSFQELSRNNTFKGLPGLLADVLPDKYGHQLIDTWLAQQGRPANSMNPVERLCFIGNRAMGALTFEPTKSIALQPNVSVELESLVQLSKKVLAERSTMYGNLTENEQDTMRQLLKIGTSAGGARPKAVIAYNPQTNEIKSGQIDADLSFEHWMIKLDGVSDVQFGETSGYGRIEMAYYLMAKDAGIDMEKCQLYEENGRAHFMTKRFDRSAEGERHHIQTWCAMEHYDFNDMGSYSYEQLFQTMRTLRLPYPAAEQMFRRMVFNVISRNCDDHTKNFAFRLKKEAKWELTPAYDICHAYNPSSHWVSQQTLSINGKRQQINRHDLLTIAKAMNIKKAENIIAEINSVVLKWPEYAGKTNAHTDLSKTIYQTILAIQ